jgi:ATP adenylyltransferase
MVMAAGGKSGSWLIKEKDTPNEAGCQRFAFSIPLLQDLYPCHSRLLFFLLQYLQMLSHLWSPWRMHYIQSPKDKTGCIFCQALAESNDPANLILVRGKRAFVILNRYPYTSGHVMIVPVDHQPSLENLDPQTRAEIMELAACFIPVLLQVYRPQGMNVGINIGEAAGAGIIDHVHMHIVPRWLGDTNFMTALGNTRVLPETLEDSYLRIQKAWEEFSAGSC